jgi:hypothetical protein
MSEIITAMKDIKLRTDIPKFLSRWHLNDTIAEVGIKRGYNLEVLLRCNPRIILAVDPWLENDVGRESDSRYLDIIKRFMHRPNVRLLRTTSEQAATIIPECSLDFVYIDAIHTYEACIADIKAWWPLVRPGGILAGHDYKEKKTDVKYGVIKAVKEFMGTSRIREEMLHFTEVQARSWLLFKMWKE